MDPLYIRLVREFDNNGLKDFNQGLFHGLTGITIFYYHLAKVTGNLDYEERADDLIGKVFSDLSLSVPADFENGLAGIGWGIEYLVREGFAEGNTDEILEEADNKIFRILNEETFNSFDLTNGLTGYLIYLINRLKNNKDLNSNAFKINCELLILCINRLYELATPHFPLLVKDLIFDLFWRFPLLLYALTEAYQLNIHNRKILCMIRQWIPNFEAYIPSMNINRVYLATILKNINEFLCEQRLEKQIRLLLYCTDFKVLINEFDPDIKSVRFGLPGILIILDQAIKSFEPGYGGYPDLVDANKFLKTECGKMITLFSPEDFKSKNSKYGLSEGITGLGLASIIFPQIFI